MRFPSKNLSAQVISLIILATVLVLPRAFSLARFVAVDEVNWLHRSANFYDALVQKKWDETYINPSPGVITTWAGAIAFKIGAPEYRVSHDLMKTSYMVFQNNLTSEVGVQPLYILAISRAIMISLLIVLLLICYMFAQRLFGILPSLVGFLIIALDPFFMALTRMNHLDAPQAVFMFLSLLAFLNYLFRGKRWFDLAISGAAGGLAFLSKLPGIFILPTIGLLSVWEYIISISSGKAINPKLVTKSFWNMVQSLLIWALVFILAYSAFWPAMWVQPIGTIQKVFGVSSRFAGTVIEEDSSKQVVEANSSGRSLSYYIRYPKTFLWRTTPIVLLGLILLLFAFFLPKDDVMDDIVVRSVLGLLVLGIIYTVGVTLPTKSSEKYLAPVYLVLDFLAGLGWYYIFFIRTKAFRKFPGKYIRFAILTAVIFIQSIWVYQSFPYYFTYYNPLLGGLSRASEEKFIGVGEGLDKAGLYLIKKPNSSQLNVMSWYGVGPLSYYFDGSVKALYNTNSEWTPEFVQRLSEMDYLVVYTNQKYRNQPPELMNLLSEIEPEHTVTISSAEYAWIYRVSDISLPGLNE